MKKFKSVVALILIASMLVGCSNGTNAEVHDKKTVGDIFGQNEEITESASITTSDKRDNFLKDTHKTEIIYDFPQFMEDYFDKPFDDENTYEQAYEKKNKWWISGGVYSFDELLQQMSEPWSVKVIETMYYDAYMTIQPNKFAFIENGYDLYKSSYAGMLDVGLDEFSFTLFTTDCKIVGINMQIYTNIHPIGYEEVQQELVEEFDLCEEFKEETWIKSTQTNEDGDSFVRYFFKEIDKDGGMMVLKQHIFTTDENYLNGEWNYEYAVDVASKVTDLLSFEYHVFDN